MIKSIIFVIAISSCNHIDVQKAQVPIDGALKDCIYCECNNSGRVDSIFLEANLSKPIDFLYLLRKVPCAEIDFDFKCFPSNWVDSTSVYKLLPFLDSIQPCVKVKTVTDKLRSYTIDDKSIRGSTVSIEALRLINSHYLKYYPCNLVISRDSLEKLLLER